MHTDMDPNQDTMGVDVYLFAHQDDEFGVFHALDTGLAAGRRPVCIYLTDGAGQGARPAVRNRESLHVLTRLGVDAADVHFIGSENGISDGALAQDLVHARDLVTPILDRISTPMTLTSHAWEGGHPDHDAAHLLALWCAHDRDLPLSALRFFALYNAHRVPGPMFRVLAPIAANGPITRDVIPWSDRLRHLRLYLSYHSQWRTLVGLYPFILLHYLTSGTQNLQQPAEKAPSGRPHTGPLLYEKRQGMPYRDFLAALPNDLPVMPAP